MVVGDGERDQTGGLPIFNILGSIVVSILACHARDRGSIPRRGGIFFNFFHSALVLILLPKEQFIKCRDSIVVSTSRCGRDNPGSNPGHGTFFYAATDGRNKKQGSSGI